MVIACIQDVHWHSTFINKQSFDKSTYVYIYISCNYPLVNKIGRVFSFLTFLAIKREIFCTLGGTVNHNLRAPLC